MHSDYNMKSEKPGARCATRFKCRLLRACHHRGFIITGSSLRVARSAEASLAVIVSHPTSRNSHHPSNPLCRSIYRSRDFRLTSVSPVLWTQGLSSRSRRSPSAAMFVIKVTLKDETRRLVFDGRSFPSYGEIQHKVCVGRTTSASPVPSCCDHGLISGGFAHDAVFPALSTTPFINVIWRCLSLSSVHIIPQIRAIFNLPSSTPTYWVHVLLFPDDAEEARIMFKQHVCDAVE